MDVPRSYQAPAMIGPHVNRVHARGARPSIAEHIEAARREAENDAGFMIQAASVFVGGPKDRRIIVSPDEAKNLQSYISDKKIRVIAHSSYSAHPWGGDPDAARFIREETGVCHAAGIEGLVVHLPKLPVSSVMKYIARLFNPGAESTRIYLEIPAVRPQESFYETPAKLAVLFQEIRSKLDPTLKYFGLCVDSAHLWTCGVDLSSYEAADRWLTDLEKNSDTIPHDRVMVHLNDSERARGVGPDTHAGLMRGKIWSDFRDNPAASGLAAFTDYAQRHGTPMILERKPKEALVADYLILRDLVVGSKTGGDDTGPGIE